MHLHQSNQKNKHQNQTTFIQLIFICLLVFLINAKAQQWHLLNGPYQGEVHKFEVNPDQTNIIYAAVDAGNKLYKSTDSGITWYDIGPERETGSYDPTVALDPVNPSIIYLSTELGVLDKSMDGGNTWEKKYILKDSVFSFISTIAIDPISTNIIYVGLVYENNTTLWKSSDSGETWSVKTSGMPIGDFPSRSTTSIKINPLNTSVIFADVSGFGLYRSNDGAENWHNTGFDNSSIHDIVILPWDTSAVVVGSSSGLYKSTNGGATWSEPLLDYYVLSIEIDTSAKILYAGTKGNWVYKSTDSGETWDSIISQEIPTSESLAMKVYDILVDPDLSNNLYLATGAGPYKSMDGGNNWSQSFNGINGFKVYDIKISSSNPSIIYAAGDLGVYRSSDCGLSWYYVGGNFPVNKISVDHINPDIVYAALRDPIGERIIRTTNGGMEWSYMTPVSTVFPFIEIEKSEQQVVYVSTTSHFLRSYDYGTTWDTINSPVLPTSLAIANNNPDILYIGSLGGVYKSIDRGETWDSLNISIPWHYATDVILDPANSQTVYTYANRTGGWIYKSTDGGEEWIEIVQGLGNLKSSPYTDININPKNTEEIYLAADSFLYQSTNGGESWNLTAPSPPNQLIYTIAIDTSFGSRMLLGGNLPGIYGLDLLTSFIKIRDQRLPLSMKLHQNYPNPFNPMTTIEYSIPQSGFVSIQVFNLLGQEIETLVNKKQKPGNYSIQFDATNLASGIYLYRIQEGKNSLIKKMVVVK